jgi:lipopolysaccharide biosynthesis regulator YciM
MLLGTEEELDYHDRRAAEELAISHRSADPITSDAHLILANLHRSRRELVTALRNHRPNRPANRIYRSDKES